MSGVRAQESSSRDTGYLVLDNGFGFFFMTGEGRAGPLKVVYVSGAPYDRGYAYGYLAGEEIYGVLHWAYYLLSQAYGAPLDYWRQQLLGVAQLFEGYVPSEYIDEMRGMADGFNRFQAEYPSYSLGFNITYLDILMINSFVDFSCTGAVISGNLTVDGKVLIGTTIDAEPLAPYFIYVVESPTTGHQIAYFTAAGSLFQNGFNDAGVGMIEHHIEGWDNVIGMPEMIRDRYVLQYADNVTHAIDLFKQIFSQYGFSGYGDDVSISDKYGNIAKIEVTPFRLGFIVNPQDEPTWPKEDPFLKTGRKLEPVPYIHYYTEGYTSVLRGKGWIVNGLYTLNETVVGIPDHPETWKEATENESWSHLWEAPERYMIAHYIYNAQIRGDKLSLTDGIIMSQLPLVGDAPHDDGAIWMKPQDGLVVILKGQASFAKPIYLKVFLPLETPVEPVPVETIKEIKANTDTIIGLALQLKDIVTLQDTKMSAIEGILRSYAQTISEMSQELSELNSQCGLLAGKMSELESTVNMVGSSCSKISEQINQENFNAGEINGKLDSLNDQLAEMRESAKTSMMIEIAILGILFLVWGLTGYLVFKKE